MKNMHMSKWMIALLLVAGLAGAAGVARGGETSNDEEVSVTAQQLPKAVKSVFDKFAEAGEVSGYMREDEGEEQFFTAQVKIGSSSFELKLDPKGSVEEVEAAGTEDPSDDEMDDDGPGGDGDGETDDD
ncbi:hypothetical protein KDL29_12585 [bacterium]|nr:hypothetical protein [bacterium]